jgi:hypothetical protein
MMDYAKSTDCILWIHLWQKERQRSLNDSWSCIVGNLRGDRLRIVISQVLAAFIDKIKSEVLSAPSWKWTSTECQWLLAFHYGKSQGEVAVIFYIHCSDCFGTLKISWILSDGTVNEMICYCPRGCGRNILYTSAHTGCHILVYGCVCLSATHITEEAWHKITDTPLTPNFKMG